MTMRNKVMHPETTTKVEEVEKKISEWKQNLRYLNEVCPESQLTDDDQLKTILISIVPESVADYLTQRYNQLRTIDDMETELIDYLDRMDQRKKEKNRKQIGSVTNPEEADKVETEEWSYSFDNEWGWICTAVPAPKRQRTEEGDSTSETYDNSAANDGKSKAKGKRQGRRKNTGPMLRMRRSASRAKLPKQKR